MKLFTKALLTLGVASTILTLHAQQTQNKKDLQYGIYTTLGFFEGLSLGGAVRFSPALSLRAGLGVTPRISFLLNTNINEAAAFAPYREKVSAPINLNTEISSSWIRGHLLVDYHPTGSPFRLSGGFLLGRYKIGVKGDIVYAQTGKSVAQDILNSSTSMPLIVVEENGKTLVSLQPDKNASMAASLRSNLPVQPYIGIGYGYAVPNSRVSFFGDFGIIYQGKFRLHSKNVVEGDINKLVEYDQDALNAILWTQVLPVFSAGISIRL